MAELTKDQKKEWAYDLYMRGDMTQKAIAEKVGISEQSMVDWVSDGLWKELRATLLTSKRTELAKLYQTLSLVNERNIEYLTDNDPDTEPDLQAPRMLTASIRELEGQIGTSEVISMVIAMTKFVQKHNVDDAKLIIKWGDLFIADQMEKLKLERNG